MTKKNEMTSGKGPDFICIGAQKAGSTWLYARLSEIKEFELPLVKELHYFDSDPSLPSVARFSEPLASKRMRDPQYLKYAFSRFARKLYKRPGITSFKWLTNYYFRDINDAWYLRHFEKVKGITGDITPSYSTLSEKDFEKMYKLCPDARIIFILRNPIDRAWSSFKHQVKKGSKKSDELNSETVVKYLKKPGRRLRSDYLGTLKRLLKYYPKEQVLVCFYDSIIDNPVGLLSQITQFLRLPISDLDSRVDAHSRDNVSPSMKISNENQTAIRNYYENELKMLADTFGGYCDHWYQGLRVHQSPPLSILVSDILK